MGGCSYIHGCNGMSGSMRVPLLVAAACAAVASAAATGSNSLFVFHSHQTDVYANESLTAVSTQFTLPGSSTPITWREYSSAAVIDDIGFLFAGVSPSSQTYDEGLNTVVRLKQNPTTKTLEVLSSTVIDPNFQVRFAMASATLEKNAILSGGMNHNPTIASNFYHDVWICSKFLACDVHSNMIYRRTYHSMVVYHNTLWVIGGYNVSFNYHDSTERYVNGHWHLGPPLPVKLAFHASVVLNNTMLVFGGKNHTHYNIDAYVYNNSAWETFQITADVNGLSWFGDSGSGSSTVALNSTDFYYVTTTQLVEDGDLFSSEYVGSLPR